MNANYIYDVFETCRKEDIPDLTIALAHHQDKHPIPDGMTDKDINGFVARHYAELVEAYKTRDRAVFAAAVAAGVQADIEAEAERKAQE